MLAFAGLSILGLSLVSGILLRAAIGSRRHPHWAILALLSLPLWGTIFFLTGVTGGPLTPFTSPIFGGPAPTLPSTLRAVLPVVGVLTFAGILLLGLAPRSNRATVALLALIVAVAPAGLTWASFPLAQAIEASDRQRAFDEFSTNQDKWGTAQLSHYQYSFQVSCLCPGISGVLFTSEVREGVPSVTARGEGLYGVPTEVGQVARYTTVEGLFATAESVLYAGHFPSVNYDREWGFPEYLSWGGLGYGEPTFIRVSTFKALP